MTMKLLFLSCVSLACAASPSWRELETSTYTFEQYTHDFHKSYGAELGHRAEVFAANLLAILKHNAKETTYKLGVNQFTDLTAEEFKVSGRFGFNKALSQDYKASNSIKILPAPTLEQVAALPDSVDWRSKQVVSAVKDQGNCGSCWAFGSTETLESHVALNTKQLMVLSPQQLVSCSKNPDHCGGTGGCRGSIPELAFDYVKENGMATEWTYPYESGMLGDQTCKMTSNLTASKIPPIVTVDGFQKLAVNDYNSVLNAVATIGPMAINIQANVWQHYSEGVFTGCSNLTNIDIDHVVSLVGYGTDPTGGDYWLVRNSWNTVWGEAGYIKLKRSATPTCGTDPTPEDGTGCKGAATQHVCGQCGVLFDVSYPTGAKLL